ncbi:MAG: flagellar hook capping FlgD N-terminal domain-containing protein, partial [Rhizobacter sp.]
MTALSAATLSSLNGTANATSSASDPGSQDRFLKLLVTQLQNQDPLSPMDNAQLTSQIAQINTVSGIATLNTSVQGLSSQFLQMQTLQGASLVGKDVIVPGNKLDIADGVTQGGFEITSAADAVKVEVLSPAGKVLDTIN